MAVNFLPGQSESGKKASKSPTQRFLREKPMKRMADVQIQHVSQPADVQF